MHYKFLDPGDVQRVLADGTIAIGSFEHYRRLEESQWGAIADRLEGASELTTPANFVATENSPELAMLNRANIGHGMFKQFASISGGGVIDMSNARFVSTLPGYVFCASWGPLPKLKQYMTEEAEHKYKACLKIRNFHRLRRRIVETGRIRELNCSFSDVFDQGQIGMVQYEIRSRSIAEGKMLIPSPFKKALHFQDQCEARIYFVPKRPMSLDRLIVEIADPHSIFEEIAL
jgi:hypothetical protein